MALKKRFADNVPGLLARPMNKDTRRVFVAATRMNDGKTTTCLGLTAALQTMGLHVGYIKPIAQRVVHSGDDQVDEDTLLIDSLFNLDIPISAMSPVAIGPDFTKQFLENPGEIGPQLQDRICRAFDRAAYTAWLAELRAVCTAKGIALILDEVFLGFRLAPCGAQEYFGVKADLVTYGKTLGGGLPVGVLCGKRVWMQRFREGAPADICFARGTFNSHPYVMGAMNVFLKHLDREEVLAQYASLDDTWNARAGMLNARLDAAEIPVQVANMSSIWTVFYTQPACYNWLFQHYLRLEGLALSWVGTGRIIFSLNYSDQDFEEVVNRFVAAAQAMKADGWWWHDGVATNQSIKRRILGELLRKKLS